jgi:uncharacterized protein (DUF488 family)
MAPVCIWTIGHSTRTTDDFLALLNSNDIRALADVRRYPGSRRLQHFCQDALAHSLDELGIVYQHFPELGGRRRPRADSPNTAWRNEAFRGYADYMMTNEFRAGVARLLDLARSTPTAVMCAEALWWRCHRGLIADDLKAGGLEVVHIMGPNKTEAHPFTSAARIVGGKLSYAAADLFDR